MGKREKDPPVISAFRRHARGVKGQDGTNNVQGTLDVQGLHHVLNDEGVNIKGEEWWSFVTGGGVDGFSTHNGGHHFRQRFRPLNSPISGTARKPVSLQTAQMLLQVFSSKNNGAIDFDEFNAIYHFMGTTSDDWEFALNERRRALALLLRAHAPRLGLSGEPLPRPSPLTQYYAADPVVMKVETDPLSRACKVCATCPLKFFGFPFPAVCWWPQGVILYGAPCSFVAKPCWVHRAAKATTLEVRESSVFSTTELYGGWSVCFGPPCIAPLSTIAVCCGRSPLLCGELNGVQERQAEVIPLELVDGARVEPHAMNSCPYGCDSASPSVVLTALGGHVVAVVDGVSNADAFVAAVDARRGAKARRPLDPATRARYAHHLEGSWLRLEALRQGATLDVGGGGGAAPPPRAMSMKEVGAMSVKELKAACAAAGLRTDGCAEKRDFAELLSNQRSAHERPAAAAAASDVGAMSVKELKAACAAAGLQTGGCAEKRDFVEVI